MGAVNRYSPWPHPYLTEQETRGVGLHRRVLLSGEVMPGLLRRIYPFQLIKTFFPGEQDVLSVRFVPSGLKTLLFGLTFSADFEFWQLTIRTSGGEILFDTTDLSSLLNVHFEHEGELPSPSPNADGGVNELLRPNRGPYVWDPCWVLDGTKVLILEGTPLDVNYPGDSDIAHGRGVLNVAFHVWEMPGTNEQRGPEPPKPLRPGATVRAAIRSS